MWFFVAARFPRADNSKHSQYIDRFWFIYSFIFFFSSRVSSRRARTTNTCMQHGHTERPKQQQRINTHIDSTNWIAIAFIVLRIDTHICIPKRAMCIALSIVCYYVFVSDRMWFYSHNVFVAMVLLLLPLPHEYPFRVFVCAFFLSVPLPCDPLLLLALLFGYVFPRCGKNTLITESEMSSCMIW